MKILDYLYVRAWIYAIFLTVIVFLFLYLITLYFRKDKAKKINESTFFILSILSIFISLLIFPPYYKWFDTKVFITNTTYLYNDEKKPLVVDGNHLIMFYYASFYEEEGKFRLDGNIVIRDNMMNRTVATLQTSDTVFLSKDETFKLTYNLPKNLPYSKIMKERYTTKYKSGLVEEKKRYSLIYDDCVNSYLCINRKFKKSISKGHLTLTYLGVEKDEVIEKHPLK